MQLKLGKEPEKVEENLQEQIAEKKRKELEKIQCPGCMRCEPEIKKEYDCGYQSQYLCKDCIRKKHEKHGLKGDGFTVSTDGKLIDFYSHTTGMESTPIDKVLRVFDGIMSNSVFPYSINLVDDKGEFEHCYGVTKAFGEWLIKKLKLIQKEEEGMGREWCRKL